MSEMIERVANAIYWNDHAGLRGVSAFANANSKLRQTYLGRARTAIAAMREPTPEMARVIRGAVGDALENVGDAYIDIYELEYGGELKVWKRAIDAALIDK